MLGIITLTEALRIAAEADLDLVEVATATSANPPVCKILDFSKLKGEIRKKQKEARKKQKTTTMKETPALSYNIAAHDLAIKVRNIKGWLEDGHKVKVAVKFKGREISYLNQGIELLKRVLTDIQDLSQVEVAPTLQGRTLVTIVTPIRAKNTSEAAS